MLIAPVNDELRELVDRAHAERNEAIITFFAGLFIRTPKPTKVAQPA